jgi:hypothetical protein
VAEHYSREKIEGEQIYTSVIIYVVTKQADHWGIKARFSID